MKWTSFLFALLVLASCKNKEDKKEPMEETAQTEYYKESFRPQFHFTPEKMWMNDPNGMVYNEGIHHLFYQYYPKDIVWGPMHWGHAVSEDLIHWEHKPIALFPDELGYIFSGSAVLDKNNSSGFGTEDNPPLVAIFTYHNAELKKAGKTNFETQGIAYSLDNGDSWTKHEDNPVISDENSTDFRDPKVMWHEPSEKWILTLVAGDHAEFYSSKNLKEWELVGKFGKNKGAHGGVWECPDLFKLKVDGTDEEKWILLISINPGAPNGGSGTQYFIGDFDGNKFTTDQTENRWIDWGTDNYAGVTFNNAPNDETVFIGWMSNWTYARETPTEKWRSAMTIPRKLGLKKIGEKYELTNYPVENLEDIIEKEKGDGTSFAVEKGGNKSFRGDFNQTDVRFRTKLKDCTFSFKNSSGESVMLSMIDEQNLFLLGRSSSGKVDFNKDFGKGTQKMPVTNLPDGEVEVRMLLDASSVEVFINQGQYVMTAQLFPNANYNELIVINYSDTPLEIVDFKVGRVKRVW